MRNRFGSTIMTAIAISLATTAASAGNTEAAPATNAFESPRLARLAGELGAAGKRADPQEPLAKFWEEVRGKTPLVEPVEGSERERWVTFVWHGSPATRGVGTLGTSPSPDHAENEFKRFGETDLWYKTERLPSDARFGYAFAENGQGYKPDPLNPRTFAGRSVAELPDAPGEPWIARKPSVPAGAVTGETLRSEVLGGEDRAIAVYLPAGYDDRAAEPYRLLVVFDGESYGSRPESAIQAPTILDNLAAAGKVRPTVALLVNSQKTRDRDLVCSDRFTDFLAKELIPWCRGKYRVSHDPSRATVAGSSYGGLCAAYAAYRHPELFGNVLSQSGSFSYYPGWHRKKAANYFDEQGWLTQKLAEGERLPIRFYLSAGLFEGGWYGNVLWENRRLRDVLRAKGYTIDYREYSGGHDYVGWRSVLPDGLIRLAN